MSCLHILQTSVHSIKAILTFARHHSLSVPLGQHPGVTIETGLLHLKGGDKVEQAKEKESYDT